MTDDEERPSFSPNEIVRALKVKKLSKKHQARNQRESGKRYVGYSRNGSKITQNAVRPARAQGPQCNSAFCLKSSLRHCSVFRNNERRSLFDDFWKMTWDQKQFYVCQLIEKTGIKQRRTDQTDSRRSTSTKYFLINAKSERLQVCHKMFLNTFGLNEKMVREWLKGKKSFGLRKNPRSIQNRKNKSKEDSPTHKALLERKLRLLSFLIEYPKMESHYCRKDTEKEYFETTHQTIIDLYNKYAEVCKQENSLQLSFPVFSGTLKNLNFCLFKPRKDQCDTCIAYKAGNITTEEFNFHRRNVDRASKEKEDDVKAAKMNKIILLCMDNQGVVLCPKLEASALYFKSKLQLHNFTIYDILSHESTNYVWDETEGDLQSSTFTSIVIHHIEKLIKLTTLPIIIYSDGCGYQNRNVVISNALRLLAMKSSRVITQKFLEVGHTHMECDSTHACIERKSRNLTFNLPDDFENAIRAAREEPFPFEVVCLSHTFFRNYDDSKYLTIKSIRPGKTIFDVFVPLFTFLQIPKGKKKGDPKVNNIRSLQYTADGRILFKLHFDDDYQPLSQNEVKQSNSVPKRLHESRLPIPFTKWKHLQELKHVLDAKTHIYYDNIPHHSEGPAKIVTDDEKLQSLMEKVKCVKSVQKKKVYKKKTGTTAARKK